MLKTKYSIITNQYKLTYLAHHPDVKIDEHQIDRVKSHRYLGIEIDDTLTWYSLIDHLLLKTCRVAWLFWSELRI